MAINAPVVGGTGSVELDQSIFGVPATSALLHEVVRAEQAAKRQGTASTRRRGEVRGGGAKPWRQKGTGRARQGTSRAPQWRGGGVVFGPHPRSYAMKVNRKVYRKAHCMAWSQHATEGSLGVFDGSFTEDPRTKAALSLVGGWRQDFPLVVVVGEMEAAAALSFRNLPRTLVLTPSEVAVVDLLWARSVLVSSDALAAVERILGDRAVPAGEES